MTDKAPRLELEREVARAMKGVLGWFCNGSAAALQVGIVDARRLDQGTLQRLAKRIEEAREEKSGRDKEERTSCWKSSFGSR
jgi:hypothetical protein